MGKIHSTTHSPYPENVPYECCMSCSISMPILKKNQAKKLLRLADAAAKSHKFGDVLCLESLLIIYKK